ncbi:MAG TPA: 4'-phosphopantetheinyl transferase superfamily protein [Solirubrobacteraceae bacterium]|nr:4'-phosphopantetheinyl transferase superfamily protein [Solirubrobacteraceae bacterium]
MIAEVWSIRLDQPPAVVASLRRLLDRDEAARAARFARERDRRRFTVGHGALRQVLATYVAADAGALRFVAGRHGKPALTPAGPHFSLSHGDGLALVAVARERPVGVDVELAGAEWDPRGVARRFFTPEEAALAAPGGDAGRRAFFRVWTCKESCVKASGRGIGDLEDVHVALDPAGGARARYRGVDWTIAELRPAPGYIAAVATRRGPLHLAVREWTWREAPRVAATWRSATCRKDAIECAGTNA